MSSRSFVWTRCFLLLSRSFLCPLSLRLLSFVRSFSFPFRALALLGALCFDLPLSWPPGSVWGTWASREASGASLCSVPSLLSLALRSAAVGRSPGQPLLSPWRVSVETRGTSLSAEECCARRILSPSSRVGFSFSLCRLVPWLTEEGNRKTEGEREREVSRRERKEKKKKRADCHAQSLIHRAEHVSEAFFFPLFFFFSLSTMSPSSGKWGVLYVHPLREERVTRRRRKEWTRAIERACREGSASRPGLLIGRERERERW